MLVDLLLTNVTSGIIERREQGSPDIWLEAYLPTDKNSCRVIEQFQKSPILDKHPFTVDTVFEMDWVEQWQKQHPSLLIADRVFVHRPWEESTPPPGAISLVIEPGMAFGTGRHETTQLCIRGLVDRVQPGMKVLDLGCGSGILAFVAAKLGAASVLALDNDPLATEFALKNRGMNHLDDKVQIACGSISSLRHSPRRFDLILVNIVTPMIRQLVSDDLKFYLRPGGRLLLSGILDSEMNGITEFLPQNGLRVIGQRRMGEWCYIEAVAQDVI